MALTNLSLALGGFLIAVGWAIDQFRRGNFVSDGDGLVNLYEKIDNYSWRLLPKATATIYDRSVSKLLGPRLISIRAIWIVGTWSLALNTIVVLVIRAENSIRGLWIESPPPEVIALESKMFWTLYGSSIFVLLFHDIISFFISRSIFRYSSAADSVKLILPVLLFIFDLFLVLVIFSSAIAVIGITQAMSALTFVQNMPISDAINFLRQHGFELYWHGLINGVLSPFDTLFKFGLSIPVIMCVTTMIPTWIFIVMMLGSLWLRIILETSREKIQSLIEKFDTYNGPSFQSIFTIASIIIVPLSVLFDIAF